MPELLATYNKDPTEVLDYTIDWETLLDGDTISTSEWAADTGITQDSESETTTLAIIWVSGGTVDKQYTLTNTIVTAGGRTRVRSIAINVIER
jgi:hypothetical protein